MVLTPAAVAGPKVPTRTASGSVAVPHARARVARAGRIYVEGKHDAVAEGDFYMKGGIDEVIAAHGKK